MTATGINQDLVKKICKNIREVEHDFQSIKGLILNESDIKCLIYNKIYSLFCHEMPTRDLEEIYASPLHSEIPWFDDRGYLRIRPDLTILDPQDLSMHYSHSERELQRKLQRKGFLFGGSALVIEIKFCRSQRGITRQHINTYRKDCQKILDLKHLHYNNPSQRFYGIVVIFNKTNQKCNEFNDFVKEYDDHNTLNVMYCTGNF